MMAMLMAWMIKMSLGKYIIDEDMIQGFSNEIGEVVKVHDHHHKQSCRYSLVI